MRSQCRADCSQMQNTRRRKARRSNPKAVWVRRGVALEQANRVRQNHAVDFECIGALDAGIVAGGHVQICWASTTPESAQNLGGSPVSRNVRQHARSSAV